MESLNISSRNSRHYEVQDARILVDYLTDFGQYHAAHWQNELEMIYLLNGTADIVLDGQKISLVQGEFLVVDTNHIYELRCRESFMQIRVRVERDFLLSRIDAPAGKGQVSWEFRCSRDELTRDQLEPYLEMCDLFKQLVPLYIDAPQGYRLKTESIILDILFRLVYYFSVPLYPDDLADTGGDRKRMQEILLYIEEHYQEPLTLGELASEFGLSREYFSRLFHKNIGISLMHHIMMVRISHFHHDLVTTDDPVMELLEKHGLTNYKLFSRVFKELYGDTPLRIRKQRQ